MIGDPIIDPVEENDVLFFLIRLPWDSPTEPFQIEAEDPPMTDHTILYSTRNRCEPGGRYWAETTRQRVSEEGPAYCKVSERRSWANILPDSPRHVELQQAGWLRYRQFWMLSRPGYSGSPIWDDNLRLWGMIIRGTEGGKDGDYAVCLPASLLYAARQRVGAVVQARLAEFQK